MDADVDLHVPAHRAETARGRVWPVLGVIAAGGALGAVARYAVSLALPAGAGGFPWGVFLVNVVGCALIGVLMVLVSERARDARTHPLVRPFLGVGVLGGFTTFSTYAVDAARLLERGPLAEGPARAGTALAYLAGTLVAALVAVWLAAVVTRAALDRREGRRGAPPPDAPQGRTEQRAAKGAAAR
ncbi:fluoride efflux transporter CrcB [Streptomyces daliensis]